jgi:hypothetical protein
LAATTAWDCRLVRVGHNGNGNKIFLTSGDGCCDSGSLRANGQTKRNVFNIATHEDLARPRQ